MGAGVSLEVEGVVEPLAAVGADEPFDVTVTLGVSRQQSLEGEHFQTHPASILSSTRGYSGVTSLGLHTCCNTISAMTLKIR